MKTYWKQNSLDTSVAPSLVLLAIGRGGFSWPTRELCSSTKSRSYLPKGRLICFEYWRTAFFVLWEVKELSARMPELSGQPTSRSKFEACKAGLAKTFYTASLWSPFQSLLYAR